MSWQCSYCETVNQDAVPICTVCERVAPVVDSFLSLEQIDHAREYEELLSNVYTYETEGNYEKMLEAALKAASTFNQNDVAVSKIHLAVKLAFTEKMQDLILSKIKEYFSLNEYMKAQSYVHLWQTLKFDEDLIAPFSETLAEEITKKDSQETLYKKVIEHILDGKYPEALTIIESETLSFDNPSKLIELRTKVQNLISNFEKKESTRRIPKISRPPKKEPLFPKSEEDETSSDPKKLKSRKFPKVKRNK